MLKTRLADGRLIRLHRGVYAVGHRQLRREGFWLAAVLSAGPGAVLSHRDAAALHGLWLGNHRRIDVTARRGRTSHAGVSVHVAKLNTADITTIDGVPVTTVARTLVDLAEVVSRDQLAKAMGEADLRRVADVRAIEDLLRRTRGRNGPGHANLTAVLAEHRQRGTQLTRSELEDRFLALLCAHRLPRPETNVHVEGIEVDALWRPERLIVELDGWAFHRGRRAFERDRDRSNRLVAAGYTVLRFTHDAVVRRPAEVAAHVLRALAP